MKPTPALLSLLLLASCSPADGPDACCAGKAAVAKKDACCADGKAKPDAGGRAGPPRHEVSRGFLEPGGSRTFEIAYVARVPAVPAGTRKLRLWIPVPSGSTVQEIRNLSFSGDPRVGREPKHGNSVACWDFENPGAAVEVAMKFECTRHEILTALAGLAEEGTDEPGAFEVFRQPDALVLVDDRVRGIAAGVTGGKTGTVSKARAIYDHVVTTMVYDKDHPGGGLGSTAHACKTGRGNCTDFHALFTSLCRAEGIASGFEIGLSLPYEKGGTGSPGGYHCWAFFRVPGRTWVPVDCSEGMRLAGRRGYFFGGLPSNRVMLSTGRDLVLEPPQAGPPLNYFVDPHAEADGRPVPAVKTWSFKDLD